MTWLRYMPASGPTANLLIFFFLSLFWMNPVSISQSESLCANKPYYEKTLGCVSSLPLVNIFFLLPNATLHQCHNTRSPFKAPHVSASHITKYPTNPLSHLETLSLSQMGEVACYTPLCPECKRPCPGGGSSKEVKLKPSKKDGNRDGGPSKWGILLARPFRESNILL